MEFTYWPLRGLGEACRQMMVYLGADFKNVGQDGDDWTANKFNKGIDFPNLPYLKDGDMTITQSYAIMRYLARKYNQLNGQTEQDRVAIDRAEGFSSDLRSGFVKIIFSGNFEADKKAYFENLPTTLKPLEDFLTTNQWSAGNKLSYVDFVICECLEQISLMVPGCLDSAPNVVRYLATYNNLPRIAHYKKSDNFKEYPVYPPYGNWGFTKSKL